MDGKVRKQTSDAPQFADVAEGLAAAEELRRRDDIGAALDILAELRQGFPGHSAPLLRTASTLLHVGRFEEAEAILAEGEARFPGDAAFLIDRAWVAYRRGDLAEAAVRWERVRQSAPGHPAGYTGAAVTLMESGRIGEAEAVLEDAIARFPDEAALAIEYARIADRRRDWLIAVERWHHVREHFPQLAVGYVAGAAALRAAGRHDEAAPLLADAVARFPEDPGAAIEHAWEAHRDRDLMEAAERWQRVRERFPDNPAGYAGGSASLREAGRSAEAETLLEIATARWPNDLGIGVSRAALADHRQDRAEAVLRWQQVRDRFPAEITGYLNSARALQAAGRHAETVAALAEAQERWPANREVLGTAAALAFERRDLEPAIAFGRRLLQHFPSDPSGSFHAARALRETGRTSEAAAILADAPKRFPEDASILSIWASLAMIAQDWPEAARRWRHLQQKFPDDPKFYWQCANALSYLGRFDEAEALLTEAVRRFPAELEPFVAYANVAIRRNDWPAALDRWLAAKARFPGSEEITHRIFEARLRLAETGHGDEAAAAAATADRADDDAEAMRRLITDFESLGGAGHGCEFGIFQRSFGTEPLGLLRWADLGPQLLAEALESEFDGVGLPEQTEVFTPGDGEGRQEYWTRDKRFWMAMRCFIHTDEIPLERMRAQACRRLQFLRDKLIADLRAGEKIFVYKVLQRNLGEEEIARLHRAVRRYGDNMLLYARYEDAAHPNGTVEVAADGLMIGYIDRFAFSKTEENLGPATDSWATICKRAHALWKAGAAPVEKSVAAAIAKSAVGAPTAPIHGENAVALVWSPTRIARLEQEIAIRPASSREHAFASLLVDALRGETASARVRIEEILDRFANFYPQDGYTFESLVVAALISCQWDLVVRFVNDRFASDWCAGIGVGVPDPPTHTVRWRIEADGRSRFVVNTAAWRHDRTWEELVQWVRTLHLFHDYSHYAGAERGEVIVNIGDSGVAPGLVFCENRPEYFLIPDNVFLNTRGYTQVKAEMDAHLVPWRERQPVAFWRGSTTGQSRGHWRELPRIRLCDIARAAPDPSLFDVGITRIGGLSPESAAECEAAGLSRPFVKRTDFQKFKYQIDVDGNTNAWAALFEKLYTGSPVLKVESALGYRQWYYDDLKPWRNFVPVAAEMGDLVEKVEWLRANDDKAQSIGECGRALAAAMTYEREIEKTRLTVGRAIRYAAASG